MSSLSSETQVRYIVVEYQIYVVPEIYAFWGPFSSEGEATDWIKEQNQKNPKRDFEVEELFDPITSNVNSGPQETHIDA